MVRVLHAAAKLTPSRGQLAQMNWEQAAADRLGLAWHSRFFCPHNRIPKSPIVQFCDTVAIGDHGSSVGKLKAWFNFRRSYYDWLRSVESRYDVLLLRYEFHDPFQWGFVRHSSRPIYFVHHTLEVPEMFSSHTLIGAARGIADSLFGPPTLRAATGVIGVTDEIAKYECRRAARRELRVAAFPNGVEYTDGVVEDNRGVPTNLLYVAGTFAVWHGLDLLLNALRASQEDVVLHLVGELTEQDRRLAEQDNRIRLHGSMPRASIREIATLCDIGLSSFALYRNHMHQACSLKVRDYLTMGLPVYAGYEDVFPAEFPYFVNGPVDVNAITTYARSMRSTARGVVAEKARPFIEKGQLMARLMSFLETRPGTQ